MFRQLATYSFGDRSRNTPTIGGDQVLKVLARLRESTSDRENATRKRLSRLSSLSGSGLSSSSLSSGLGSSFGLGGSSLNLSVSLFQRLDCSRLFGASSSGSSLLGSSGSLLQRRRALEHVVSEVIREGTSSDGVGEDFFAEHGESLHASLLDLCRVNMNLSFSRNEVLNLENRKDRQKGGLDACWRVYEAKQMESRGRFDRQISILRFWRFFTNKMRYQVALVIEVRLYYAVTREN